MDTDHEKKIHDQYKKLISGYGDTRDKTSKKFHWDNPDPADKNKIHEPEKKFDSTLGRVDEDSIDKKEKYKVECTWIDIFGGYNKEDKLVIEK